MSQWQPFPIVGGSYKDDTRPWSAQDTINMIPVAAEKQGTRSPSMLRCAPGFSIFSQSAQAAPCRRLHNVEGTLFGVIGDKLYTFALDGTATALGTIPGVERVSMAHNQIANGNQIAIAANNSGYVYDTVAGTLAQISDEGFPGSIAFAFVDQYIIGIDPSRNFAFNSMLADATSYNALDRMQAEAQPDKLVGLAVTHDELWLFGERTIQPFQDTVATEAPFESNSNTVLEVGCASGRTICNLDNSIFWLGNDGIVYRANGYTPQRVSIHAIEQAIAQCSQNGAFAFTFEDRGHKVYYLTFPDGQTWGYDAASGEWHRRQSYGLDRWRINDLVYWNGKWIGGDYANGKLYALDWNAQHENGAPFERRRITGVAHDNENALIVNGLRLTVQTGESTFPQGAAYAPKLSGDLPSDRVGTSGTMQYEATGLVAPYRFKIASGALPPGVTMDDTGLVTYSYTTGGHYSWVVQAADAIGRIIALADSADVSVQQWWATVPGSNTLYYSDDLVAWNTTTRSPSVSPSATMAPLETGIGRALIFSNGTNNDEVITNFAAPIATTLGAAAFNPNVAQYYPDIDAIVALQYASANAGATAVWISTDGGNTFTSYALPGPGAAGITRLNSGRWLIVDGPSAGTSIFRYTDSQLPTGGWVAGASLPSPRNAYSAIASNGTTASCLDNGGNAYTTTNGVTLATVATSQTHESSIWNGCAANGNTFVFALTNGGPANVLQSADAGGTWATRALPYASSNPTVMRYGNGAFVLSTTATKPIMSVNDGLTWTSIAALPAGAQVGLVEWVP